MPRAHTLLLASLVGASMLLAGCVGDEGPARSVPLESIAPRPPPIGMDATFTVGYALESIVVSTWFDAPWDPERGERALAEMGYARTNGSAYVLNDTVHANVQVVERGFWLNVTYHGIPVDADTHEEAQALAEEAWHAREPHFVATLAGFQQRADVEPARPPALTYSFVTSLRPAP